MQPSSIGKIDDLRLPHHICLCNASGHITDKKLNIGVFLPAF